MTLTSHAWELQAECARPEWEGDEDLWHPDERSGAFVMTEPQRTAKRICAKCPVRLECLSASFKAQRYHVVDGQLAVSQGPEGDGIWGGFASKERKQAWKQAGHDLTRALALLDVWWQKQKEKL